MSLEQMNPFKATGPQGGQLPRVLQVCTVLQRANRGSRRENDNRKRRTKLVIKDFLFFFYFYLKQHAHKGELIFSLKTITPQTFFKLFTVL